MCCLRDLFLALFSMAGTLMLSVAGLVIGTLLLLVIVKVSYSVIFPKRRKVTIGYEEQWFGKEDGPPTDEVIVTALHHHPLRKEECTNFLKMKKVIRDNLESTVKPFKIDVSEEVLEDLKRRLQNTRYEDTVEDTKFLYGFNPKYLRQVVDYWLKDYNWREQETRLNQYPQFKTRIEGIDVHFIHVKPELPPESNVRVLPLMIIHGWPGSVVEFYKIIPLLTTPRPENDFVFEVICPSIPGFGFSESPHRKGFTARAAARMFVTLMERIGHNKFYVQGGDWGSAISSLMARYYSPRIQGLHMNMFISSPRPWEAFKMFIINFLPFLVTKAEYRIMFPFSRLWKMWYAEGAYFHMQSTKPDTLGCAMADSPAGMAAYLIEKFSFATNPEYLKREDGGLTEKFTMDELLTNVMLYWVNNNFTAAARFYKENLKDLWHRTHEKVTVTVPTAIALFPNEVLMFPKTCMSEQIPNLVSYNIMPRGGHFAALEEPQLLADDIWQFVRKVEK